MGHAIPLQHGANQFSLSVIKGKPVPHETASAKFQPASLAVTQSVRHNPFIHSQHNNTPNPVNPPDASPPRLSFRGPFLPEESALLFSSPPLLELLRTP